MRARFVLAAGQGVSEMAGAGRAAIAHPEVPDVRCGLRGVVHRIRHFLFHRAAIAVGVDRALLERAAVIGHQRCPTPPCEKNVRSPVLNRSVQSS